MDKKALSERDICTKFIAPAIRARGRNLDLKNPRRAEGACHDTVRLLAEVLEASR